MKDSLRLAWARNYNGKIGQRSQNGENWNKIKSTHEYEKGNQGATIVDFDF